MEVQKISSTAQRFNGVTYYLCGQYFQHRGKRLHRAVWEYHFCHPNCKARFRRRRLRDENQIR